MLLQEWLNQNNQTQLKLAQQLDIGPSALNRIIKGHTAPSWYEIRAIWEITDGNVGVDDWAAVFPTEIGLMLEVCDKNRSA